MDWLHSIDPIGVGDIAGVLWFILGRMSISRPGATLALLLAARLGRTAAAERAERAEPTT